MAAKPFRAEKNGNYTHLLVHNIVRWLIKKNDLERFWSIGKDVLDFLESQQNVKAKAFSGFLRIHEEIEALEFLFGISGVGAGDASSYSKVSICQKFGQ